MGKTVLILQSMMKGYRVPFFKGLYELLQREGIDLRVAYGDPPASEKMKRDNAELAEPWGRKIKNRWLMKKRLLYQSVFAAVSHVDLVVVEQANKNLVNYALLVLSALGLKKVAYWGHGYDRKGDRRSFPGRVKRWLIGRVDWWFAYTPGTTRYLLECGVPAAVITTVYNSFDSRRFREELDLVDASELRIAMRSLGLDERKKIGLYCGSLYRERRIGFLLKASARVREALPEFELIVIGGGTAEGELTEAAREHRWIHYLGPRFGPEKAVWFRMAHLFLHPGVVGLSILDAFTAGIPMITTDISGHGPEIDYLEDGVNGMMLPYNEERYAEEVVNLFRDEVRLFDMRLNALESGEAYSIEKMIESFKDGIVSCLATQR